MLNNILMVWPIHNDVLSLSELSRMICSPLIYYAQTTVIQPTETITFMVAWLLYKNIIVKSFIEHLVNESEESQGFVFSAILIADISNQGKTIHIQLPVNTSKLSCNAAEFKRFWNDFQKSNYPLFWLDAQSISKYFYHE